MSEYEDHIIKARFQVVAPEVLARIKEIAETDYLPTDPAIIADDLQTVAGFALRTAENVEVLIQLIERIAAIGTLTAVRPSKPTKGTDRFTS